MSSSSGGNIVNDPQKYVDSLLNDLRTLSTEGRRKHESVKEVCVLNICSEMYYENVLF